jgi:mRNA-degrading endonuclease toxin of MazEF toxin-antitoxin module
VTPAAGEIWLADRGDEVRRPVYIISDTRFHRLADRVVIAPVLDQMPAAARPWHVPLGERALAVNLLATVPVDRLLERVERPGFETLRQVRRAVREIAT